MIYRNIVVEVKFYESFNKNRENLQLVQKIRVHIQKTKTG